MDSKLLSRIAGNGLTRRSIMRTMAQAGLVAVVQPVVTRTASAHDDPAQLVSFTWAGYDIPDIIGEYQAKYGTVPQYSLFGSVPEAAEKLASGFQADVVHPCAHNVQQWFDRGLIRPIDVSRLSHWPEIWPEFQNVEGVRLASQDDQVFMVPFDWGSTSICYRTDKLPADVEESWNLLLDPAYKGRISMVADTGSVVGVALALGIQPYSMNDEELERVRVAMKQQRELVRFYWNSGADLIQAFGSGEVDIAVCYNDHAAALAKTDLPVKFAHPKEGIITWLCGMVISSTAEADDELIYDFLNAMLSPETGAFLISEYGYGHSNTKSFELVAPERLAALGISNASEMLSGSVFATQGAPGMRDKWEKLVEEVTTGM